MKKQLLSRILSLLMIVALLAGIALPANAVGSTSGNVRWKESDGEGIVDSQGRLPDASTGTTHEATDIVRVSIVLNEKPTIQAGFATKDIAQNEAAMAYSAKLLDQQEALAQTISTQVLGGEKLDVVWNLTLVGNIISANVPYGKIEAIAELRGVKSVNLERTYEPQTAEKSEETFAPQMATSNNMTGSTTVWAGGYTGAGSRIAIIDTGTDTDHQSFGNEAYLYALKENAEKAGLSYEEYLKKIDILDKEEIAEVLPRLNVYKRNKELTADDLFVSDKLAFGYNYIDNSLYLTHDEDQQGEHGSHVAGIAAANRYIYTDGYYKDAIGYVGVAGVAPDAQIITMKVFGISGSTTDGDYFAAIEDAVLLGCDSVNLSLGTSSAGEPYEPLYEELLDYLTGTDIVVVGSAGNAGYWADYTNYEKPYSDDMNFDTVGAPGSYTNWMTVASVKNTGVISQSFTVKGASYEYKEGSGGSYASFTSLDTTTDMSGVDYEYVMIDGYGNASEYPEDIELKGKILICSRGSITFSEKANTAGYYGAAACIIYNNTVGDLSMDLSDYGYNAPCVSIRQESANAIREVSEKHTSEGGITYYTGTIRVSSRVSISESDSAYMTMSDFSSWGIPGNLSLKPEITAPGGNIYSVFGSTPSGGGSTQYEIMSGTSMASPQIAGMVALVGQYIRENDLTKTTGVSARHLAMSLLMSTAKPIFEEASGYYYSLLSQGAGLGRVDLATTADSYIKVNGQDDYKVKAELGDDPERTGVYEFSFSINNLTDSELHYALRADLFRQAVTQTEAISDEDLYLLDTLTAAIRGNATFTSPDGTLISEPSTFVCDLNGDGKTDADDADYLLEYLLGNVTRLHADGDVNKDGKVNTYDATCLLNELEGSSTVTVPAGGSVTVNVRLELSAEEKQYLDTYTPNGTYIEAFVYATSLGDGEGSKSAEHSIPVLAFYGNWSDPSMFDRTTWAESATEEGSLQQGGLLPYMNGLRSGTTFVSNLLALKRDDGYLYQFGGNYYAQDKIYLPERAAMNNANGDIIASMYYTLIRNAAAVRLTITDVNTGEVYLQRELGETFAAYFNETYGSWYSSQLELKLNWAGTDAKGNPLPEGTQVKVTMVAAPSYYSNYTTNEVGETVNNIDWDALGKGTTLETLITIDNSKPVATDVSFDALDGHTLRVTAQDNEYVAAVQLLSQSGSSILATASFNQTVKGTSATAELDLSGITGEKFKIAVYDYAHNVTYYDITLSLPEQYRPYFTVCAYTNWKWIGIEKDGSDYTDLATTGTDESGNSRIIRGAEYIDGYVFAIDSDTNDILVTTDSALYDFHKIGTLDASGELGMTNAMEIRYNKADGKIYILYYSNLNSQNTPYLATMNPFTCELEVVAELPMDVNSMAIDGEGNFYSVGYGNPTLYTYTVESVTDENPHWLSTASTGWWSTRNSNSLAWDHNEDKLYWAYPNMIMEVNTETGECTRIGDYFLFQFTGLYIRPNGASGGGMFDETEEVISVGLDYTEARTLVNNSIRLTATVLPWNLTDDTVIWSSSDPSVATVDESGKVTGVSAGEAVITATSVLDETKSAGCTVTVMSLDKTLNGLVWDADGDIYWSEFHTGDLPEYKKLSRTPVDASLASTAVLNGKLYAATVDTKTGVMRSDLYSVDPETFEITKIGSSNDGYSDIAPAPNIRGGSMIATYGGYIMFVNPETGNYYAGSGDIFHMFQFNLVGITYVGSDRYYYPEWGWDTYVDWYLFIDDEGYVYMMGWLEQDGTLYYLEYDDSAEGIFTKVEIEAGYPYMNSLHYDGDFLYYSCYDGDNTCTLYAIDTMGTREAYVLGSFDDGVWPVGGLMEPGLLKGSTASTEELHANISTTARPKTAQEISTMVEDKDKLAPMSSATVETVEKSELVKVEITAADASSNGLLRISYDPNELKLVSVTGHTASFAYATESGIVEIAYAEKNTLEKYAGVATLVFESVSLEEKSGHIFVDCVEMNQETDLFLSETINVRIPAAHPSDKFSDVNADAWYRDAIDFVVKVGLMEGYPNGTFKPDNAMTRAELVLTLYRIAGTPDVEDAENPFKDIVDGYWAYDAIVWAYDMGIVSGRNATTFDPQSKITREETMTMIYRMFGSEAVAEDRLSSFTDSNEISDYAKDAMNWAVANGLIIGANGKLDPRGAATRAQIATIVMRVYKSAE